MLLFFARSALGAPVGCDAPVERAVVDQLLDQADASVVALDAPALAEAVDRARMLVVCVDAELPTATIAHLYRVSGISRYVGGDLVNAVIDFEVARALAPEATIDETLGKPLRMTYDAVPPPTGLLTPLPPPVDGTLVVDGAKAPAAPADRAYFLQWVGDDGTLKATWLMAEGAAPPYPLGKPSKKDKKEKDK